jgi:hypothetical protein
MNSAIPWISKRRRVNEPLHPQLTIKIARRNLVWHVILTGLFSTQIAWGLAYETRWWAPLTVPLVIFNVGYFIGSVVQRQKIVIVRLRQGRIAEGHAK